MSFKAAGPFAAFAGKLTAYVCKRERIEGSYLLVDAILRNTGANRQATVTAMTALTSEVSRAGAAGSQGDVQRFTMQEVIGDEFFADVQYDVAQLTEYTGGDDAGGCNFILGFTYYTAGSVSHQKFESKGKRRTGNKLRNGEVIHHRTDARQRVLRQPDRAKDQPEGRKHLQRVHG